jgi:hypothetical protein
MRRALFACFAIGAIATACSDDTAPSAPVVARLVMKDHSIFVFSARHVAIYDIVTAYDSSGRVMSKPPLTATLPAGWTRVGDTLVAPAGESKGTIRLTAASGATTGIRTAALVSLDLVVPFDTAVLNSVYDLRGKNWQATWACRNQPGFFSKEAGVDVDSAKYVATVDTVFYPEDSTHWIGAAAVASTDFAELPWHGYEIRWPHAGGRDSLTRTGTTIVPDQRPDSILFRYGVPTSLQGFAIRTNPGLAPRHYLGGTWCDGSVWADHPVADPMHFDQVGSVF